MAQTGGTATPTPTEGAPGAEGLTPGLGTVLPDVVQFPGWRVVVFLLVIVAGIVASKYVVRLAGRPIAKRFRRQSVAQTVIRLVRLCIVLLAVLFGASLAGLQLGDLVLSVTVFSAVLGVVLAPLVGSIINGLFILADEPYEIGDMIELDDGTRGFVEDITIRYTKIFTLDNTFITIPNSNIRDRQVVNYSSEDERTRLSLAVVVTYESDIPQARTLIERAARECEEVIEGGPDIRIGAARYPASPTCYIDTYGDHGVTLTLRYWSKKPYKLLTVRSKVQTRLWDLLDDEDVDVEIAYPHQHLVFDETSGEAQVAMRRAATGARPAGAATRHDGDPRPEPTEES